MSITLCMTNITSTRMPERQSRSRIHTGIAMSPSAISFRTIRICTIDIGIVEPTPAGTN